MNPNVYIITVVIVIVLISLLTVYNNTYIFKRDIQDIANNIQNFNFTKFFFNNVETFQNSNNAIDGCELSNDMKNITLPKHDNTINPKPIAYKDDIEGPLIHYKKIQRDNIDCIIDDVSQYCYVSHYQQNITHMNEVYQKIIDDIDKACIKLNVPYISGIVYIIICKDDNKEIIGEINVDVGANSYDTDIYIIYTNYIAADENNFKIIQQKNDDIYKKGKQYIEGIESSGKCDMYIVNPKNKMFYNLN